MLDIVVKVDQGEAFWLEGALELARRQQAPLSGMHVVSPDPSLIAVPETISQLASEERNALNRRGWWLDRWHDAGVSGDWGSFG